MSEYNKNNEDLISLMREIRSGKKTSASNIVEPNPDLAAAISKLITPIRTDRIIDAFDKKNLHLLNNGKIQEISSNIQSRIKDSEYTIQLFPDIELAIQILVCSIISPKGATKVELTYKTKSQVLPISVLAKLNDASKTYLEEKFPFEEKFDISLRDTLFNTGSYILSVIPESSIDEIINGRVAISTESINNNLSSLFNKKGEIISKGILGSYPDIKPLNNQTSLETIFNIKPNNTFQYNSKINKSVLSGENASEEDYAIIEEINKYYDITDNFDIVKLPKLNEKINDSRMKSILKNKISIEEHQLVNPTVSNLLFKSGVTGQSDIEYFSTAKTATRKTVGIPLELNWPSESIIVIHTPGDETNHIGYFGLIDEDGYPLSGNSSSSDINLAYSNVKNSLSNGGYSSSNNSSLSSMLINKARKNLEDTSNIPSLDNMARIYSSIIEKDIKLRLKNSILKGTVDVDVTDSIYRIMLARALSNKLTRLVFLPKELVTYFAFKYHKNGIGKSYLDDLKTMTSIRAILLFAKIMAKIKNSINITTVNMQLSPNDPDPIKTIEVAMHDIAKVRQQTMPLGLNNPADLLEWISKAGLEFTFEGHPGLPQTKLEFDTRSMQHVVPDDDLDNDLRKQSYMSFGLSPELIDNAYSGNFAITEVLSNNLNSKRISGLQRTYAKHITSHYKKILSNDANIVSILKSIILSEEKTILQTVTENEKQLYNENRDLFISIMVNKYIENFIIELPKLDTGGIENSISSFEMYVDVLDKAIPAYINNEILTGDLTGKIADNVDTLVANIKYYFMRKWLVNNSFLSELNDIVVIDKESNKPKINIYEESKNHMESIINSCGEFIEKMMVVKKKSDKKIDEFSIDSENDSYSSSSTDMSFNSDSNFDDLGPDDSLQDNSLDENTDSLDDGTDNEDYDIS